MLYNKFYKNGFVIKSYEEIYPSLTNRYLGIGRFFTWPLDTCTDSVSVNLNNEALERWLGYHDNRPQVIPDSEYLQRYIKHCLELKKEIFCLQIESFSNIIRTQTILKTSEFMGFDYADIDMCTSCLYDDIYEKDIYYHKYFKDIDLRLNDYGMFSTLNDMIVYLRQRQKLVEEIGENEQYICPSIIRIHKVLLDEFI